MPNKRILAAMNLLRTAFISGASSGFGEAIARQLAASGKYRLILNARRNAKLVQLKTELSDMGVQVFLLPFDVRSREEVESAVNQLPAEWRSVDVLVNNAGLALDKSPLHKGDPDDWDAMIDTNVKGLLYLTREIFPLLSLTPPAHIVNIGSVAGKETYPGGNVYCASKFAVDALSRAMRQDFLAMGIRVTQISPGAAQTEFSLVRFKGDESMAAAAYRGYTPLQAEDIASVVLFALEQPPHVCLNDIVITCTAQADTTHFHKS